MGDIETMEEVHEDILITNLGNLLKVMVDSIYLSLLQDMEDP